MEIVSQKYYMDALVFFRTKSDKNQDFFSTNVQFQDFSGPAETLHQRIFWDSCYKEDALPIIQPTVTKH